MAGWPWPLTSWVALIAGVGQMAGTEGYAKMPADQSFTALPHVYLLGVRWNIDGILSKLNL